jgi:hypothetical protein
VTTLILLVLAAPVPKYRPPRPVPPVDGVYLMREVGFEAVLWFRRDGSYGARWNGTNYEGRWKLNAQMERMDIMERVLGSPEPLHPWAADLSKMRRLHGITE